MKTCRQESSDSLHSVVFVALGDGSYQQLSARRDVRQDSSAEVKHGNINGCWY